MTPDEYKDKCDTTRRPEDCWIHWRAVTRQWDRLFPQRLYEEPITLHFRVWDFYVHWTDGQRGRVNFVNLCYKHSARLWQQWGLEGAEEVRIDEAMAEWYKVNGERLIWKR